MRVAIRYFRNSFLVTLAGLGLGAFLGWDATGSLVGGLSTMFIVAVLAILEVSLSFDNAVVNATVLKKMTPVWRRRFITWGSPSRSSACGYLPACHRRDHCRDRSLLGAGHGRH